jgi:hypothetical protein
MSPGIHVFLYGEKQDVDRRDKPGHDERGGGNQLRGAEMGGGPRPTAFFGFSVPT